MDSSFKIKKRDGSYADYSFEKVERSIRKTFEASYGEVPKYVQFKHLRNSLETMLSDEDNRSVEKIQDYIEEWLMDHDYYEAAKDYILYREKHKNIRNWVNDKLNFISHYKKSSNTANATIDDNSNVSNHNIAVLNSEIHKPDNQAINLKTLEMKVRELYPEFDYKQMMRDFETIGYLHDSSSQIGMPYCVAISLYPFLTNGLKDLGGLCAKPENIDSFCGIFINLIFAIASQYKGAVAVPGLLLCMDWYIRRAWGDDYYKHLNDPITSEHCVRQVTIEHQIHQYFQQICYSLMQPSQSRGSQSVFWNLSIFDKPFFDAMYGDFAFPDFSKPQWESLNWLQKDFLHWLNQERLKTILTFPVVSVCLIYQNGEFVDNDLYEYACKEYAEGNSFFTYISDSADSLSSCCFDGDEVMTITNSNNDKYLIKIKDFVNSIDNNINKDGSHIDSDAFSIESFDENGGVKSTPITGILKKEFTGTMFDITTQERQHIQVTEDHLILVKNKETGQVEQISAEKLSEQPSKYLIAVND